MVPIPVYAPEYRVHYWDLFLYTPLNIGSINGTYSCIHP